MNCRSAMSHSSVIIEPDTDPRSRSMPDPGTPLEKLGFLTIGLFDADDPAPGTRPRCEVIELGERLGFDSAWRAAPAPAVRHLLAGRRPRRRDPAHPPDRARHRRHPARLGEPAAAGRGPRHRRRPVRRPAQPRRQRRPADALGRRQGRALPGHRRRRGLQLRAGRAAAAARRAASRPARSAAREGIEEFSDRVEPHSPGLRDRMWYGGAQPRGRRSGPASTG